METFRFREFKVYQDARKLYTDTFTISKNISNIPIRDQLQRSALSIVLNIAEGTGKHSDRELARYLKISLGSVNETLACLDGLYHTHGISQEQFQYFFLSCENIAKQLAGFMRNIYKGV